MKRALSVAVAGLLLCPSIAPAQIGTAFTYQGRLIDGGGPASGSYDFQLILYDAPVGGSQVGPVVALDDVAVASGVFTSSLDFGAVFTGAKRWLEIAVRPGAATGAYNILSPRQELTPAPHAVYAAKAGDATTIAGLTCLNGQVAKWSGSAWTCGADDDSSPPTASAPIASVGNNFSLITCGANQIYKMNAGGTAWTCNTDANTTYTASAGGGLILAGTVFDTNNTVVARKDAAAGNQAFDTDTLFLDYTNDRVGIGDATPDATLDVDGGVAAADASAVGVLIVTQAGGADGPDADLLGGTGGLFQVTTGLGGPARNAGDINLIGSTGGVATSTGVAGEGGDLVFDSGNGGSSAFASLAGGSGGDVIFTAGNGGNNTGGGTGGVGGTFNLASGIGGTNASGGGMTMSAGAGAGTGNGGSVAINAGGTSSGAGGNVAITAGGTNAAAGGEITLTPGTSPNAFLSGAIQLGGSTSQLNATGVGAIKVHVVGGDMSFAGAGNGIILRSPNGSQCRLLTITDLGAITLIAVACP